jgi:pimeloyl-ACP methyl ester carboxylesterase
MKTTQNLPLPRRRALLAGVAGVAGLAAVRAQTTPARKAPFVLVHGAWHGAWCWQALRPLLAAAGHEVFTPTFTGMGARHHLSSAAVGLATHTQDLVALLQTEELQGAVVVAHSYAGYPATAALAQVSQQVARLIYLDALLPTPGKASSDAWPPQALAGVRAALVDGFRLASFPPAAFGVPEDHPRHAWLKRRLTDMPITPLTDVYPANAPAPGALPVPSTYVRCTQNSLPDSGAAAKRAAELKIPVVDVMAGHDAMVTAPTELAKVLLRLL